MEDESSAKQARRAEIQEYMRTRKRKPPKPLHDGSQLALGGNTSSATWAFSKAPRFKDHANNLRKSQSGPSLSASQATTRAPTTPAAQSDADADEFDEEEYDRLSPRASTWNTGWSVGGSFHRFDGGSRRFAELPARAGQPRPKQYDPASVMGEKMHLAYQDTPKWSFAGGRSRDGKEKRTLVLADMTGAGIVVVPEGEKQGEDEPAATGGRTAEVTKPQDSKPLKAKKKLCRGFGSETRLPMKGGMYQIPFSPGPAAYDVPRDGDLKPIWSADTLMPWGKRSEQRPDCSLKLPTDAGPGEHTAHHPFWGPFPTKAPIFGHPLREVTRDNYTDLRYDLPSYVTDGPKISIGKGARPDFTGGAERKFRVSPDAYDPDHSSVHPHSSCAVFGSSSRAHESEGVDPDEPPGPGAHNVRKEYSASDKPSAGLSQGERKTVNVNAGCGTMHGPKYDLPSTLGGVSVSMAKPITRASDNFPGPADYSPSDKLCVETMPSWRSPQYTSERRMEGEKVGRALEESRGSKLKPVYPHFVPKGPKYSLGARRQKIPGQVGGFYVTEKDTTHRLNGSYSSMRHWSAAAEREQAEREQAAERYKTT